MKIPPSGPKPPSLPDVPGTASPDPSDPAKTTFADKIGGPGGPTRSGGSDRPLSPANNPTNNSVDPDPVAAIAADLDAGRITPQEAVERVVEAATASGIPNDAPEAMHAELRDKLMAMMDEDPYLASKARRIGVRTNDDE